MRCSSTESPRGRLRAAIAAAIGLSSALSLAACHNTPPPRGEGRGATPSLPREGKLPPGVRPGKPEGHLAAVRCLAFSPDGRRLVSGSEDSTLLVWDVSGGRVVQRLEGHIGAIQACAFLPDGQSVVSGGAKGEVFVWDVGSGEKRSLEGVDSASSIYSIGVRQDGGAVIAGTSRGQIIQWDLLSDRIERPAFPAAMPIWTAGYLDDNTPFVGGERGPVLIFANKESKERKIAYHVSAGVALPGRRLILGGDGEVALLDADDQRRRIGAHEGAVYGLAVSPRRDWILAGDDQGNARAWDITTSKPTLRCELPKSSRIFAAAIDPTGASMAVGGEDNAVVVARAESCAKGIAISDARRFATPRARISAVAAGESILLGDSNGGVSEWLPASLSMTALRPGHHGEVTALAALPNGGWVSGGADRLLYLSEPGQEKKLRSIGELKNIPSAILPTPDGASIIAADLYGDISLAPLGGGAPRRLLAGTGAESALYAMALRPGVAEVAAGGEPSDIVRAPFPEAREPARFPRAGAAADHVTAVAYSPDGHYLLEADESGPIAVRDAATGQVKNRLQGLRRSALGLVVTKEHVWAGGSEGILIRYPLAEGAPPSASRFDEGSRILSLAKTPDDHYLVAGLADGRAAVHELPGGGLVAHLMPMRDGSWVTLFPDGRFRTSGSGDVLSMAFEDPTTRKVATLGGLLHLTIQSPTVTRAEKAIIIKATVLSPQGEPSVLLDGRWPVRSLIPSPTVMSAYDLDVRLADTSGAKHSIDVKGPGGEKARVELTPEPYLRGASLHPRALIIGNAAYPGGKIPALSGAIPDAMSVEKALRDIDSWGLRGDQLTMRTNLDGRSLKTAVDSFFSTAKKGETLLFYYAGHGIELGGEGYLLPVDFSPDKVGEALSATELWKAIERSEAARAVVLLDACRSASFAFPTDVGGRLFNQSSKHALVTATSAFGLAGETAKGGRFTQALIEALDKTEAIDQEREAVTLGKAFLYAYGKAYPQQLRLFGGLDTLPLSWPRDRGGSRVAANDLGTIGAMGTGAGYGGGAGFRGNPTQAPPPAQPTGPGRRPVSEDRPRPRIVRNEMEEGATPEPAAPDDVPGGASPSISGQVTGSAYEVTARFTGSVEQVSVGVYSIAHPKRRPRPEIFAGPFKAGETSTLSLPLRALPPGDYTVIVKACSASDGQCSDAPLASLPAFRLIGR